MSRNSPMVLYLRRWLPRYFPMLRNRRGRHPSGVGGLAARGRYHPTGRAADIFLEASLPQEKQIGDLLFQLFINDAGPLGVDHVIWNRQIWSTQRGGPRQYTGASPHTNHIHVFFTKAGASQTPALLLRRLDGIWQHIHGGLMPVREWL